MIDALPRPDRFLGNTCAGVGHDWKPLTSDLSHGSQLGHECQRCGLVWFQVPKLSPKPRDLHVEAKQDDHHAPPVVDLGAGYRLFRAFCLCASGALVLALLSAIKGCMQ